MGDLHYYTKGQGALAPCEVGGLRSPEVPRVYIGSFWDAQFRETGMRGLMEAEEADLVTELASLPEDNVMNKINEIARRARLVQVHATPHTHIHELGPSHS